MQCKSSTAARLAAQSAPPRSALIALAASTVAATLFGGSRAQAADYSWISLAGGAFWTAANWDKGAVPGAGDRAIFNLGTTGYTLTTGSDDLVYNDQLIVGNDVVYSVMGSASGTYHLTGATDSVIVGDSAGQKGVLNIGRDLLAYKGGGGIYCRDFVIGNEAGATGSVNLASDYFHPGGLQVDGVLTVGRSGAGAFYSAYKTLLTATDLAIAALPGSTGSFSLGAAEFQTTTINGNVYVGGSQAGPGGRGNFDLNGGGTIVDADFKGTFTVYSTGTAVFRGGPPGFGNLNDATLKDINVNGGYMRFDAPGAMITGDASVSNGGTLLLYQSGSLATAKSLSIQGGTVGSNGGSLVFSGDGQIGATNPVGAAPSRLTAKSTFGGAVYIGGSAGARGASGEVTADLGAASVQIWPAGNCWMGYNITAAGGVRNDGVIGEDWVSSAADDVTINGSYTQGSPGELYLRLFGGGAGQSDRLIVNGSAALDGTLELSLVDGLPKGDTFTVLTATGGITGAFANLNGTFLVGGELFSIDYLPNAVTVTHIPEPVLVSGLLLPAILGLRRRRSWPENSRSPRRCSP